MMVDHPADAPLWQPTTPSVFDPGWDTWDEFITYFDFDANGDPIAL